MSVAQQSCSPASPLQVPMSKDDAQKLLRKVVGWRMVDEEGEVKLQCLWKLRDFKCMVELINRIYNMSEPTGHFPDLHIEEQPNFVRAELWTSSVVKSLVLRRTSSPRCSQSRQVAPNIFMFQLARRLDHE